MVSNNGGSGSNGSGDDRQEQRGQSDSSSAGPVDSTGGNVISPKSGWRVEEYYGDVLEPGLKLNLTLYVGLEVFKRIPVWQCDDGPAARGEMSRELIIWQAAAQYLNSGGNLGSVVNQLNDMVNFEEPTTLPEVSMPPGFFLLQTQRVWFTDENGSRERVEHMFINEDTREAVRWIEDIEAVGSTMQELLDELYEEDDPFDET